MLQGEGKIVLKQKKKNAAKPVRTLVYGSVAFFFLIILHWPNVNTSTDMVSDPNEILPKSSGNRKPALFLNPLKVPLNT